MTNLPFNWPLYIKQQTQAILDRLAENSWTLYLEVGGHFLVDNHASRVLPWYLADSKAQIFKKIAEHAELNVLFCINVKDIVRDRQFGQKYSSFEKHLMHELKECEAILQIKPTIVLTMLDHDFTPPHARELEEKLVSLGHTVYHKYLISGYPKNTDLILSPDGYGQDAHIHLRSSLREKVSEGKKGQSLILVSACGSNSGKFNTCLSQLYLDHTKNIPSNYAKYETFPIRNLPLDHPINLAYEAATADIGDYNMVDPYYTDGESINYNRDVEAFEILKSFWNNLKLNTYNLTLPESPTAMGINTAGFCLDRSPESEKILSDACRDEIQSRIALYTKLLLSGHGEEEAITKCEELLKHFK